MGEPTFIDFLKQRNEHERGGISVFYSKRNGINTPSLATQNPDTQV